VAISFDVGTLYGMVEKIKVCWGIPEEYRQELLVRYGIEIVTYSSGDNSDRDRDLPSGDRERDHDNNDAAGPGAGDRSDRAEE